MEKNGKIELDLSEEQLQEITGGCAYCEYYQKQSTLYSDLGSSHTRAAEAARQAGNATQAMQYINDAHKAFDNATKYQDLLKNKLAEHASHPAHSG